MEGDMKKCRYWFRIAVLWLLTLSAASAVHAQAGNYPGKPVTVISDAAAGATPDVDARFVAEGLSKIWGQQVVVINRPGQTAVLPPTPLPKFPLTAIRFSCLL